MSKIRAVAAISRDLAACSGAPSPGRTVDGRDGFCPSSPYSPVSFCGFCVRCPAMSEPGRHTDRSSGTTPAGIYSVTTNHRPPVEVALELAASGLPVFPCGPNQRPVIRNGHLGATTDPAIIRAIFKPRNATLIGVPTGEASGFDVRATRRGTAQAVMVAPVRVPGRGLAARSRAPPGLSKTVPPLRLSFHTSAKRRVTSVRPARVKSGALRGHHNTTRIGQPHKIGTPHHDETHD